MTVVVLKDVFSVARSPDFVQVIPTPSIHDAMCLEFQYPIAFGQNVDWAKREYDTRCSIEGPSSTEYFAGRIQFKISMPWSASRQLQHMTHEPNNVGIIFANLLAIQIEKADFDLPVAEFTFPTFP